MSLLDDRDRIANDLADGLVHHMFAISLDLHAALAMIGHDHAASEKISRSIKGLDQAINGLRRTIYDLGHSPAP